MVLAAGELGVGGYVRKEGFEVAGKSAAVDVIARVAAGVEPESGLGRGQRK